MPSSTVTLPVTGPGGVHKTPLATTPSIRLQEDSYFISGRLWAFASFFRFARPGSVRVGAESSVEEVYVSAFVNKNAIVAVPVNNAAHFAYNLTIDLFGVNTTKVTVYLTDNSHNVSAVGQWAVDGSTIEASVEPRAMKTFFE
jgi:glucosylceramidase